MAKASERTAAAEEAAEAAKRTARVVLKRARVIVIPDGVETLDAKKLAEALGVPAKGLVTSDDAWLVVASGEGSKTQAIEAFAGKPGTPDAKVGAFRAPNLSSWQGGAVYSAPPLPLVQRAELED